MTKQEIEQLQNLVHDLNNSLGATSGFIDVALEYLTEKNDDFLISLLKKAENSCKNANDISTLIETMVSLKKRG